MQFDAIVVVIVVGLVDVGRERNDGYQAGELEIQLDTNPSNAKETVIKQPKTRNIEEHDSNGKNIKYEHVRNFAIQNTNVIK